MAVKVVIKNKIFLKKSLKFRDVLMDDMCYGTIDESYCLEEGQIGKNTTIFSTKSVCRGYEISFDNNNINLRMLLPTSKDDIRFFYKYIKMLCEKMGTKKFIRDGELLSLEDIEKCIKLDIEASEKALEDIRKNIDNGIYKNIYFFGAVNPVAIGKKEIEQIDGDLEKLGEFMNSLQTMDVYYAKASFWKSEDNTNVGVYNLMENLPTVLPYKPKTLLTGNDFKVDIWNICLIVDEKPLEVISYDDFFKFVKKKDVYDAEHFIVTMDEKEIKEMISKCKKK